MTGTPEGDTENTTLTETEKPNYLISSNITPPSTDLARIFGGDNTSLSEIQISDPNNNCEGDNVTLTGI